MVLLQIPLAVEAGTVIIIGTSAVTELTSAAAHSLLQAQWKEEKLPKEKIKEALKKRILHLDDTSKFERKPYAKSPILRYMKERCRRQRVVYVAFVLPGMGTTACYAFLQKYAAKKSL
jgi:isochorismate hydrolase